MQRLQNFRLYHFQDARVARVAKFQTLSFFWISRLRGLQRLQSFILYHFQDIKVEWVGKFHTLSFSGYQGCEGCKFSDFIIFRISRSPKVVIHGVGKERPIVKYGIAAGFRY